MAEAENTEAIGTAILAVTRRTRDEVNTGLSTRARDSSVGYSGADLLIRSGATFSGRAAEQCAAQSHIWQWRTQAMDMTVAGPSVLGPPNLGPLPLVILPLGPPGMESPAQEHLGPREQGMGRCDGHSFMATGA